MKLLNKLKNFPTINFISVEDRPSRRNKLLNTIDTNFGELKTSPNIFKRYAPGDYKIKFPKKDWFISFNHSAIYGENSNGFIGAVTSHLESIKKWYENTDEEYGFFCEDDLSFDTVNYWNFSWEDFLSNLPEDWDCVQLQIIKSTSKTNFSNPSTICYPENKLRKREIVNWGCCAYIIKRDRARRIIDSYYNGDEIILEYNGFDYSKRIETYGINNRWAYYPSVENIVYTNFKNKTVYSFPLFVEDISQKTTFRESNDDQNIDSYFTVMSWWKSVGYKLSVKDFV